MSKRSPDNNPVSSDPDDDHDDERRHRNRERNKEHARKTRVRKKEQLQGLKDRVYELEEEGRRLKQSIQECSIASILLGLSSGAASDGTGEQKDGVLSSPSTSFGACLAGGKRKRFLSLDGCDPSPPPMELNIKGQVTLVGGSGSEGKTNINWKTGVYVDNKGKRQQLTKTELETLRRERNRMHAKMTRDRKKCFIASLKRVISKLEEENQHLRETLEKSREDELRSQAQSSGEPNVPAAGHSSTFLSSKVCQSNVPTSMFSSSMYTVG